MSLGWALATLTLGAPAANAQEFNPIPLTADRGANVSVTQRSRPEYDPIGVDLGSVIVLPSVDAGVGYSNNVFGSATSPRGDVYIAVDPQVTVNSKWPLNSVALTGAAKIQRFAKYPIRDETGLSARLVGHVDGGDGNTIDLSGTILRDYEEQYSSAASTNALQPIEYVEKSALVRGTHEIGRIRATLGVDYVNLKYRNLTVGAGSVLDESYRDRNEARAAGRVEYSITPNAFVFGEIDGTKIDFSRTTAFGVANRSGSSYTVLSGIALDVSALIRARAGVGYFNRSFDAGNIFRNISGPTYDVRLEYFPSGITTVTVSAVRSIEETVDAISSGYISNRFLGRVDHELLRNLLLFGEARYELNRFRGASRLDKVLSANAGGTFRISRRWGLTSRLEYDKRSSTGLDAGTSFDEVRGLVSINFRI